MAYLVEERFLADREGLSEGSALVIIFPTVTPGERGSSRQLETSCRMRVHEHVKWLDMVPRNKPSSA